MNSLEYFRLPLYVCGKHACVHVCVYMYVCVGGVIWRLGLIISAIVHTHIWLSLLATRLQSYESMTPCPGDASGWVGASVYPAIGTWYAQSFNVVGCQVNLEILCNWKLSQLNLLYIPLSLHVSACQCMSLHVITCHVCVLGFEWGFDYVCCFTFLHHSNV